MQLGRTKLLCWAAEKGRGRTVVCTASWHYVAACLVKGQAHPWAEGYWWVQLRPFHLLLILLYVSTRLAEPGLFPICPCWLWHWWKSYWRVPSTLLSILSFWRPRQRPMLWTDVSSSELLVQFHLLDHALTATFLGFILSADVHMYPIKVKAVVDWPQPTNWKQLQWFLGVANFYIHFI